MPSEIMLSPSNQAQNIKPSYIREILAVTNQEDMISLAGGLPDQGLFPMHIIQQAMDEIKRDASLFQYGSTQGYPELLNFVRSNYITNNNHDTLICTGSQQALDLIARAYINPGDQVLMEAPSYLGSLQVFELAGATIHCIEPSQDLNGPNLEKLAQVFEQNNIKLFYAVPDFHNPTGICWTKQTRIEVARLCEKYGVYFIEDAPYRELRFTGELLPEMASLYKNTIYMKSFSKIATPGMRIGAVIADKEIIQNLIKIKQASDLHSSIPMQALLLKLLTHKDFKPHFTELKKHYHKKHDIMIKLINEHLKDIGTTKATNGGMFLWLSLNSISAKNVEQVARMLLKNNIAVVPSNVFYPSDFPLENQQSGFRLNFTHANIEQIEKSIIEIKRLLEQFQSLKN